MSASGVGSPSPWTVRAASSCVFLRRPRLIRLDRCRRLFGGLAQMPQSVTKTLVFVTLCLLLPIRGRHPSFKSRRHNDLAGDEGCDENPSAAPDIGDAVPALERRSGVSSSLTHVR